MPDKSRMIPLASAATLALVIGQGAVASPTPEASGAAVAPAPPSEPAAAAMSEREKRYEELRANAAAIGLKLPETPPWKTAEAAPPAMPAMPEPPAMPAMPEPPAMPAMPEPPAMPAMPEPPAMMGPRGMSPEDFAAMRQKRQEMFEKMRSMSPEERRAMRDAYWEKIRGDAAERGIEMPETPPWAEAEQRRKEMEEQFEKYRKTIEQMSEEEIEAARALFGGMPPMRARPGMPPGGGYGYGPYGGYPEMGPPPGEPGAMGAAPMMPPYAPPAPQQGPPQPEGSPD